jgi:hypothetical protein
VETTPKASGCFMGGTRAVREEPGKQKPRSAICASRVRDCGRGNSPEAAPKQKGRGKGDRHRSSSAGRDLSWPRSGSASQPVPHFFQKGWWSGYPLNELALRALTISKYGEGDRRPDPLGIVNGVRIRPFARVLWSQCEQFRAVVGLSDGLVLDRRCI